MKKPLQNLSLGLGAVFCGLMLGMTQQPSPTSTVDTAKIADTIVNESANIRYDELVLISGATRDQQLLEDIAVVVVDDHSVDSTAAVAQDGEATVLRHPVNLGNLDARGTRWPSTSKRAITKHDHRLLYL